VKVYTVELETRNGKPTTLSTLAKKEREMLEAKKQKAREQILKALGLRRVK